MSGRKRIDISVTKNSEGEVFKLNIIGTQKSGRNFLTKRPLTREGCLVAFWDIGIQESKLDDVAGYRQIFKDQFGQDVVVNVIEHVAGSRIQPGNNSLGKREQGGGPAR